MKVVEGQGKAVERAVECQRKAVRWQWKAKERRYKGRNHQPRRPQRWKYGEKRRRTSSHPECVVGGAAAPVQRVGLCVKPNPKGVIVPRCRPDQDVESDRGCCLPSNDAALSQHAVHGEDAEADGL